MKIILIILVSSLIISCDRHKETYTITDVVKYENDSIYSQGDLLINTNGDTNYTMVGRWVLKYPSGQIWSIDEYDTAGNLSSFSTFYPTGTLKIHYISSGNTDEYVRYAPTGQLMSIESTNNSRDNSKFDKSITQQFYVNGMVLDMTEGIDGADKIYWVNDTLGKTMLRMEWERGRWVKRMHPKPPPNERDDN